MATAPDDLCLLAELKAWLPNQGSNDDSALQSLITNGSVQILQYINRPHLLASILGTINESYDGNGSDRLLPRNFPINSVTAVTVDGVGIPASQGFAGGSQLAGYLFDSRRIMLRGFRFCRGLQNVSVTYTAGYTSIPLDLKQAAIETLALMYRQRTHIGEKSNAMGGQITLSFDMSEMPPRSVSVFNQYRRVAMP